MERRVLIVKHEEDKGPGFLGDLLMVDEWTLHTVELARGEKLPGSLDGIAGIVSLGGRMNVYEEDRYPFLEREDRLIRKALIEEVPFLGLCLGAQLLAKACGAQIKRAAVKETGWHNVTLTADGRKDLLFYGSPERMKVFQWHEDVFDVPEGGTILASGKTCANQAFRVGRNAYGLQFHIEVTAPMVEDWAKNCSEDDKAPKMAGEIRRIYKTFGDQAARLCSNFQRIMETALRIREATKMFAETESKTRHARSKRIA